VSAGKRVRSFARIAVALAAFLGFIATVFAPSPIAAQSAPGERTFKNSKDAVESAVKDLHASASGRLPMLDGFVEPPDESLERFERGFFQCEIQVTPAAGGGTLVRVTAKITAWYADPNSAKAGYRQLPSNGRIEADYLDRLEARLGGAPAAAARSSKTSPPPSHNAKNATAKDSGGASPAVASADPPPPTVAPGESLDAIRKRVEQSEKQVRDLNAYLQNLEQIKQNQSHPNDLVVVKKSGTPVLSKPQRDAEVLFSAEGDDEFQILELSGAWVHVQISGESRGWIRRTLLDLPAGYAPAGGKTTDEPADADELFHIAREETSVFAGTWEPLKGKTVKLIWAQPNSTENQLTSPRAKREYAKSVLLNAYSGLGAADADVAGVVIVFDAVDGGQIAATRASLQQLKSGNVAEPAFWKQCSLDPPEAFLDPTKP
jgi:hypothetical protein